MIAYHFTSAEHAISNIANKRIKVAELDKLNDPFELLAVDTRDKSLRRAFRMMKSELAGTKGITCFSKSWRNPVQWSHYGDRFRGVALGFEVPDGLLVPINYVRKRMFIEIEEIKNGTFNEQTMLTILTTKFTHWRYEKEVRGFCNFTKQEQINRANNQVIFQYFSEQLRLKEVRLGPDASQHTEHEVQEALAAFGQKVELIKTRLAFRSFSVVRDMRHTRTPES
jgi:hypothetical protein